MTAATDSSATRQATNLQKLVHEDMAAQFRAYPALRRWGAGEPDANIDHRRVPNLMTNLTRRGYGQAVTSNAPDYLPGDLVAWDLGAGVPHIGMVSDRKAATGTLLVVHNIGAGAREDDILFRYAIIGHYRL